MVYSRDVTWHNPEVTWVTPMRVPLSDPPKDMYFSAPKLLPATAAPSSPTPPIAPAPGPSATPPASATAPATSPVLPAPVIPTPPPTASKPPPSVPVRIQSELEHEGYREMPGRTRGETRALREASREFSHRQGLVSMADHAALVSMLATRQSIDKLSECIVRQRLHRICPPLQLQTSLYPETPPTSTSRHKQIFGDTQ